MKRMLIAALLLLPILVTAQSTWTSKDGQMVTTDGKEKRIITNSADEAIKQLTKRLNLTDEQVKKVHKVYENHQKEIEKEIALARVQAEMEAAGSGGGARTMKIGSNLRGTLDKNIESILTPKQKKEYEKIKKERKSAQPQVRMFQQ